MSDEKKLILIMMMLSAIGTMKTAAGISDLGELDTEAAALKTAYDTDPASVTEAAIDALHDKLAALKTPDLNSVTLLWKEADQVA